MGVVKSGADRAGRDAEQLGDLGGLESDEMAQHDEGALLGWQASESTFKFVASGHAEVVVRGAGKVHGKHPDRCFKAPLTLCLGDA